MARQLPFPDTKAMPLRALLYRRPTEPQAFEVVFSKAIYLVRLRRHRQARRYTLRIQAATPHTSRIALCSIFGSGDRRNHELLEFEQTREFAAASGTRDLGTNPGKYRFAGISVRSFLVQQLKSPLRANCNRINLQCERGSIYAIFDVPRFFGFLNRAGQDAQPFLHGSDNGSPDWTRSTVEFERSGRKKTATGEHLLLHVTDPAVTELPQTLDSCRLGQGRMYDIIHENAPRHLDRCQLQITLRSEVSKKAAFAHF